MAIYLFIKQVSSVKNVKFYSSLKYKKCYQILGVTEESDQEEIRRAYLKLVKQYHPDSGTEDADAEKFQEIDEAFRKLINKKSKERWDVEETLKAEEQDIKHTAPQHRQYLSYGGIGSGTPFQREKQYAKFRAIQASDNVYQHRIAKVTADEKALLDKAYRKAPLNHKIKTKYGFERLVEDLIQESISKGEFDKLSGVGKPLKCHDHSNPYVDYITHKLNEVLIENGFTPEWITLQKEIREEAQLLRKSLLIERQYFGPFPLSVDDNIEWSERVFKYKKMVVLINQKISKFNLVVPILDKQMIQVCLEKEAQKAMLSGKCYEDLRYNNDKRKFPKEQETSHDESVNLVSLIYNFFKGK